MLELAKLPQLFHCWLLTAGNVVWSLQRDGCSSRAPAVLQCSFRFYKKALKIKTLLLGLFTNHIFSALLLTIDISMVTTGKTKSHWKCILFLRIIESVLKSALLKPFNTQVLDVIKNSVTFWTPGYNSTLLFSSDQKHCFLADKMQELETAIWNRTFFFFHNPFVSAEYQGGLLILVNAAFIKKPIQAQYIDLTIINWHISTLSIL